MGKAIPISIKSKARSLLEDYDDKFGLIYYDNKKFIQSLKLPFGKLTINWISAHITRSKKRKTKEAI